MSEPVSSRMRRAAGYPKFASNQLTILLLDGNYHLHRESRHALQRMGHRVITIPVDKQCSRAADIVRATLLTVLEQRPDFLLSINHIGFDRAGSLADLLEQLELPVAVWYVDSPWFVLRSDRLPAAGTSTLFVWERTLVTKMRDLGASQVRYLPLATDPNRFAPTQPLARNLPLVFVGDSMTAARQKWRRRLTLRQRQTAHRVSHQLLKDRTFAAGLHPDVAIIADATRRADLVAAATWAATARYRIETLRHLNDEGLVLFGDTGWKKQLPSARLNGPVDYGPALAAVYATAQINLSLTSLQMPTAVNQRIFDVPAAGGFLLSDAQADVARHFELGSEAVTFSSADEMLDLVRHYKKHPERRAAIAQRARARVLAEHTYEHRLTRMLRCLGERYGRRSSPWNPRAQHADSYTRQY